jgi:hypothetical protein
MTIFRAIWQSALVLAGYAILILLCIYVDMPHVMAMTLALVAGFVAMILISLIFDD